MQIRQALQGESWSVTRSTSPAATAYVVSGLTNDKAYTFQVRAQLDAADFACWSAPVTVVPRRVDDVMEEIEKHQRAIAERMAEAVKGMADGQEALQVLGEKGIAALEAAATSTSEVAGHVTDIRDGVGQVAVASRELQKFEKRQMMWRRTSTRWAMKLPVGSRALKSGWPDCPRHRLARRGTAMVALNSWASFTLAMTPSS